MPCQSQSVAAEQADRSQCARSLCEDVDKRVDGACAASTCPQRARTAFPGACLWMRRVDGRHRQAQAGPAGGLASLRNSGVFHRCPAADPRSAFHLHLISDATGETLTTMAKAAAVQYPQVRAIEHVHPLVRTERQLERVLDEVERAPGIVLYTLVKKPMIREIERRCRELNVPCLHVLQPDHEGVRVLPGGAADPGRGRPAHARRRLFPAHRRAQLRDGPRRRPAAAGLEHGRHHPGRHLAHLEDADQHLSGPARLQDRQRAAGAGRRAARGADRAAHGVRGRAWWPAPSASPRSAATACT